MKHCSNCKYCVVDAKAIRLCGVYIHRCKKKGSHILHPFFSGFRCKKYTQDDGKGCATCKWNDTDPNEVGCPCWNCKGDYSEYAKSMKPEAFDLFLKVLKDMGELED